jgi:large-conductance mechanosensitive channel
VSLLQEFRAFALKGNVVDLAVGVIGKEIPYGLFLGWVMKLRAQEAVASPAAPPPTRTEALLTEIRDLLKGRPA